MTYVSIDLETTGLNEENCQIIEIGALIDDFNRSVRSYNDYEPFPKFHAYIVREVYHGEPFALSMHKDIFSRIASREVGFNYLQPQELGEQFHLFLLKNGIDSSNVTVAGKNFNSFDKLFLNKLPYFNDWVRFHRRTLDPAILFFDPLKDEVLPSTEECKKRAGLDGDVSHTAIADARDVIYLLREGLKRLGKLNGLKGVLPL